MNYYVAERVKKIVTRVSVNEDRSEKPSIPEKSIETSTDIATTSPSAPIDPNPELLNYQFNGRPPQLSGCKPILPFIIFIQFQPFFMCTMFFYIGNLAETEEISDNWEDELRSEVLGNDRDRDNKIPPTDTFPPNKLNRRADSASKIHLCSISSYASHTCFDVHHGDSFDILCHSYLDFKIVDLNFVTIFIDGK